MSRIILAMAVVLSACVGPDSVTIPLTDPAKFFAKLVVREPAVTLVLSSGANTVQLHVAAEFADGSPVSSPVLFDAGDSTILVDSTGLVTARFPTTNLAVVRIAVTEARHTRRDSVLIRVLAHPPTVAMTRLSVSLPAGASAIIPVFTAPTASELSQLGHVQLQVEAMNDAGQVVPREQVVIALKSSDPTIAMVTEAGLVTARRPGPVVITARTVTNGRLAIDSLALHIGLSQSVEVQVVGPYSEFPSIWRMGGETIRIGVGGVVLFTLPSNSKVKVDLVFDDTTHIAAATRAFWGESGAGNIRGLGPGDLDCRYSGEVVGADFLECLRVETQARRFTALGRYHFTGAVAGGSIPSAIQGVVVVCAADATECEP